MRKFLSIIACFAVLGSFVACNSATQESPSPQKQEMEFLRGAIRHHSPDVQKVEIIGDAVVYTHIFDGIIDIKTYTYDGDECVEAERVYTFPSQMSALRHYRNAIEKAELYDKIEMYGNEVRYKLKEDQQKVETEGLTKEQLKEKFDNQIKEAKAEMKHFKKQMKCDYEKGCKDCYDK